MAVEAQRMAVERARMAIEGGRGRRPWKVAVEGGRRPWTVAVDVGRGGARGGARGRQSHLDGRVRVGEKLDEARVASQRGLDLKGAAAGGGEGSSGLALGGTRSDTQTVPDGTQTVPVGNQTVPDGGSGDRTSSAESGEIKGDHMRSKEIKGDQRRSHLLGREQPVVVLVDFLEDVRHERAARGADLLVARLQSAAIGSDRQQSGAIGSNQEQSEAIRSNQQHSRAIKSTQEQSGAVRSDKQQPAVLRSKQLQIFWSYA